MSKLPLINYIFSGGSARNRDGGQTGQLHNATYTNINASLPDWGALTDALSFRGSGSFLTVPKQTALLTTTGFAVEMAIRFPALGGDRMNLFQGFEPWLLNEPAAGRRWLCAPRGPVHSPELAGNSDGVAGDLAEHVGLRRNGAGRRRSYGLS